MWSINVYSYFSDCISEGNYPEGFQIYFLSQNYTDQNVLVVAMTVAAQAGEGRVGD